MRTCGSQTAFLSLNDPRGHGYTLESSICRKVTREPKHGSDWSHEDTIPCLLRVTFRLVIFPPSGKHPSTRVSPDAPPPQGGQWSCLGLLTLVMSSSEKSGNNFVRRCLSLIIWKAVGFPTLRISFGIFYPYLVD